MGKNKDQAHHTSTYFHTYRVSIFNLIAFAVPALAGVSFGSRYSDSVSCPYRRSPIKMKAKLKARTLVGGGEEGLPCDLGSELLLGWSARIVQG